MKAGFSRAVITPPAGTPMAGYRLRRAAATGTHDQLQARCVVVDDGQSICALLSLDLLGLSYRHSEAIKQRIASECGLQPERTLIACTHTHSGPDLLSPSGFGGTMESYCRHMYGQAARCVYQAMEHLETMSVSFAQTAVPDTAFNRRIILRDASAHLNLERIDESQIAERGPVDSTASILLFGRADEIGGAVSSFTMHATVLNQDNLLFTRDWPGYLVDTLQGRLPGNPVVLFFNGAFGNINQIGTPGKWISTFREAQRIGRRIGGRLAAAMESRTPIQDTSLTVQHTRVTIPRRRARGEAEINEEIARLKAKGDSGSSDVEKELIFLGEEKELGGAPSREQVEIQRITLGEVEMIGLPGEIFVEYGLQLKRTSPVRHCLIFGNANGSAGYVPLAESFEEGGYETRLSHGSRLVPEAGMLIIQAVENLRREAPRSRS